MVTGRTPNPAETSLLSYMMGGPIPGFFRGQPRQSKKPVFWSCHKDEEWYTATSRDEAIENDLTHDEWPREVTVWGVARELVDADDVPSYMLEEMVDRVGERYSADSTDDEWPRPTDAMIRAHEELRETVRREFTPSTVVEVCSETVNVREWCQEHAPHWLPENITVSEGE